MSGNEEQEEKEKKRKKRMRDLMVHLQTARMLKNVDVSAPSEDRSERSEKPARSKECSEKLATVYKSIALRRREATDRWNRFAGTSGGGGRGR